MKNSLLFGFIYSVMNICIFLATITFIVSIKGEVASYLLWYYLYGIVLNLILFPLGISIIRALPLKGKLIGWFIFLLILLNIVPYCISKEILTVELVKDLLGIKKISFPFSGGIHIIAFLGFIVTSIFFKEKGIFRKKNGSFNS